jgi:hypothetical protein
METVRVAWLNGSPAVPFVLPDIHSHFPPEKTSHALVSTDAEVNVHAGTAQWMVNYVEKPLKM